MKRHLYSYQFRTIYIPTLNKLLFCNIIVTNIFLISVQSFCLSPMTPNPLCGVYRQFQLENMEGYMAALGAGMMSRNMVLRSQVTLRITEVGTSSRLGKG